MKIMKKVIPIEKLRKIAGSINAIVAIVLRLIHIWIISFIKKFWPTILISILSLEMYFSPIIIFKFSIFQSLHNYKDVLSIIIGSLSSILGILFAVLFVAGELIRRRYPSSSFKNLFSNQQISQLFQLFISTIMLSIFTLMIHNSDQFAEVYNNNLTHLCFLLFTISLLYIFPSVKNILTSTLSQSEITKIANDISSYHVDEMMLRRTNLPPAEQYSSLAKNPIMMLTEAGIATINNGEFMTPKLILEESTRRLIELLNPDDYLTRYNRDIIRAFYIIYEVITKEAIKSGQRGTIQKVLDSFKEIHLYCAENKFPWHQLIELNKQISAAFSRIIESDLEDVASTGIWTLERILTYHLENNIPMESELTIFTKEYSKSSAELNIQWQHVSDDYIRLIYHLIKKSIHSKKFGLTFSLLNFFSSLPESFEQIELGESQKSQMYTMCHYYVYDLLDRCVKLGIIDDTDKPSIYSAFVIDSLIEKGSTYVKVPLYRFGQYLLLLADHEILGNYDLGEFCTMARMRLSASDKSKISVESILYVIDVLNTIKTKLDGCAEPFRSTCYVYLFEQVESLRTNANNNVTNDKVTEEISLLQNSFNRLEEFKQFLRESHLNWPEL